MRHVVLLTICVGLFTACLMTGCGESGDSSTSVKPMDDYRDEAAKAIDADNVEAELEKLTVEINADAE